MSDNLIVIGKEKVAGYQILALRSALGLEIKGMKHSRGSAYATIKKRFGFKGNKQKVYNQLDAWIKENLLSPDESPKSSVCQDRE